MAVLSTRSLTVAALLLVAARADAQMRISISRAVSNNNSDNSGINVGGSQVAGNTFGPTNVSAGSGSRNPISNNPTGAPTSLGVTGGTVSTTGLTSNVAPTAGSMEQVAASLSSGTVTAPTASGGTITITMSPQTGQVLAGMLDAQTTTSWTSYVAARIATVDMLMSFGVDAATSNAVASALANAAEAQAALHPAATPARALAPSDRARPQVDVPLQKEPAAPASTKAPASRTAPSRADAAVYSARAVAQMSSAIQIFMTEQPGVPIPAPMLAAAVVVSAAARQTLPLPAGMRSTGTPATRK